MGDDSDVDGEVRSDEEAPVSTSSAASGGGGIETGAASFGAVTVSGGNSAAAPHAMPSVTVMVDGNAVAVIPLQQPQGQHSVPRWGFLLLSSRFFLRPSQSRPLRPTGRPCVAEPRLSTVLRCSLLW